MTAVGTALTSSGFVAEGVPTRALPWIPHRGAVRRVWGFRLGGRYGGRGVTGWGALTSSGFVAEGVPTLTPPWVPHRGAERRREGCDGGGDRPYVERVRSRRGPHGPYHGTASGCGTTVGVPAWGAERRREGCDGGGDRPYVERVRYHGYRIGVRYDGLGVPAWGAERRREGCDGGGDRPYVERVRSRRGPHPYPTMGTASGCGRGGTGLGGGTTREGWVPTGRRYDEGGVGTGSGCGRRRGVGVR